jgi:tRNA(fMet)-specific endonuclease VapC
VVEPPSGALLDTSAVIRLPRVREPVALPQQLWISSITLAELSLGPIAAASDEERTQRQRVLQQAERDLQTLPFDDGAARAFAGVAASLRSQGRKPTARSFDALIAAVAIANGLPLYTANPRDFEGIAGLTVISLPPVPDNDADGQPDAPADSSQPSPSS